MICYLHAFSRPTHQTIASRFPGAPTSAICRFSVPRSLSCLMWRLLQCSDTLRLLADCPRVATAVFGLVMAIPAFLFLACLHMKLTRVHLHVLRTHLQRCRHLLRSVLTHFRQPMVTSPSSEGKTRKFSCEENIAPRRVVDAWCSNRHSLRPRRKHESGIRGATKLHRARLLFSILAKVQFLLHLRSLRATNKQSIKPTS